MGAKSNYSVKIFGKEFKKIKDHKALLMGKSPSMAKLDPCVKKIDNSFALIKVSYCLRQLTLLLFLIEN